MGKLSGKVAFITGAARGQGHSHAIRLAEDGADIVAIDLRDDVDTASTRWRRRPTSRTPSSSSRTPGADPGPQGRCPRPGRTRRRGRRGDRVVRAHRHRRRNAGIATTMAKTWELSDGEWQDVIDVNLTGVWRTVKATVPAMIEGGDGGTIVLTSSLAGSRATRHRRVRRRQARRHRADADARQRARGARHPGQLGVPGLIHTDMMMNEATYDLFRPELEHPTKEDVAEVFRTMQVLPTDWLEPRDVSEIIAFLASDAARFITGVAMPIDAVRSAAADAHV